MEFTRSLLIFLLSFFVFNLIQAQFSEEDITKMVSKYKDDPRGPYKDIRWFCPDGSTRDAKDPCPDDDGFQKARYKDEVITLAQKNKIYLGQTLMGNTHEEFYDLAHQNSKAKQYIIEKFLQANDNGWVLRKAQFYRGAIQAEDEENWGKEFLTWSLGEERFSENNYYFSRELVKYIQHGKDNNNIQIIRALSKNISDRLPSFMNLRVKIHGNPKASLIEDVKAFIDSKSDQLTQIDKTEFNELVDRMEKEYNKSYAEVLKPLAMLLHRESTLRSGILDLLKEIDQENKTSENIIRCADLLSSAKEKILEKRSGRSRLIHMDVSLALEAYALSKIQNWQPETLFDKLNKTCYIGQIVNASGYTHQWEYDELLGAYSNLPENKISFRDLLAYYKSIIRHIQWSSAMIQTEFGRDIQLFNSFEPLANGFTDDRIRSGMLLPLGEQAADIYDLLVKTAGWENKVFDKVSSSIQGINPGFAKGKLIVADQYTEEIDPKAIYLFRSPPSDLEPVSGILSISEGNMVSHLQLLARNLGIPNGNISETLYNELVSYEGKEIFYAVSNRGGVKISLASEMTDEENQLFRSIVVDEDIVTVPTSNLQLTNLSIPSLDDLDATSSGVICGPKAANFSQLKRMFPDQLVNGMVITFAIFKDHMLQQIPGENYSYWQYLIETFDEVERKKSSNENELEIENYTLDRLAKLARLIKEMPIKPELVTQLENKFSEVFGKKLGEVRVFLRSDTNMEDLKDFTGAGLNLTVFNTMKKEDILQGIRNVWASPYSERSYKWRQKYLSNPQDVYPSILIIPSVFVDNSGVIITKDFIDGQPGRINLAISQGVGGAVDGQKAESWILSYTGEKLLVSPARDPNFKKLSPNGGTVEQTSEISKNMLTDDNIRDIWKIIMKIEKEMPDTGMNPPYDIEFGFENDKLWLFQIRPFVENKKATSSIYLSSLDPYIPGDKTLDLYEKYFN